MLVPVQNETCMVVAICAIKQANELHFIGFLYIASSISCSPNVNAKNYRQVTFFDVFGK